LWPKFTGSSIDHKKFVQRLANSRAVVSQRGIGAARFRVVQAALDLGQVLAVLLDLLAQFIGDLHSELWMLHQDRCDTVSIDGTHSILDLYRYILLDLFTDHLENMGS
jgi:hypothetical protein